MTPTMNNFGPGVDPEAIQLFHRNLKASIKGYDKPLKKGEERHDLTSAELLRKQKGQMESLVEMEKEFRQRLIAHSMGNYVYKAFVKFICETQRNILAARPYFRERQKLFTKEISKALKKRNEKTLYRFQFNFKFVLFVMRTVEWKPKSPLRLLFNRIAALREELIVANMPLALNRARLFFSKTPTSHLAHMDIVQIASEGLMAAIDKYVLPFSSNFRSVAIGRMVGNFIENYSETLIHFYPVDKRKIYRANKNAGKHVNGVDHERLSQEVNKDVKDDVYLTNPAEIQSLMAAASCVSADSGTVPGMGRGVDDVDVPKLVDRFEAPEETRPDVRVEQNDALQGMFTAINALALRDMKLLRMRGVNPNGFVV